VQISNVTVKNYRSITTKTSFDVSNLTVLVGPNNEGKSNLINALALSLGIIQRWAEIDDASEVAAGVRVTGTAFKTLVSSSARVRGFPNSVSYSWDDDYPRSKQDNKEPKPTVIRIDFQLDPDETIELRNELKINTNGVLPIEISIRQNSMTLNIIKQGPGKTSYSTKSREIAEFISTRLTLVYIPAIRTGEHAVAIANQIVKNRLHSHLRDTDYAQLLDRLNDLRKQAVTTISTDLLSTVQDYVPDLKKINLHHSSIRNFEYVRSMSVLDTVETDLQQKGDGVKSLITIALLQELARDSSGAHSIFLALDEPEAHLHPTAVREIATLLKKISHEQQVLLATHNPLLVNREVLNSNVIVEKNQARVADDIASVRKALGVEIGDNLSSAEVVVLVEGKTDKSILSKVLGDMDPRVLEAIRNRRVVFKPTKGSGKMRAIVLAEQTHVSKIIAVLDNDAAGKQEVQNSLGTDCLPQEDLFTIGGTDNEIELEDLIEPEVYLSDLNELFGRNLSSEDFAKKKPKWAKKLELALKNQGFSGYCGRNEDEAKIAVSLAVENFSGQAFKEKYRRNLRSLNDLILAKLH